MIATKLVNLVKSPPSVEPASDASQSAIISHVVCRVRYCHGDQQSLHAIRTAVVMLKGSVHDVS